MRLLLVAADPLDPRLGSGTAMAVARLRAALTEAGVDAPVLSPRRRTLSATLDRAGFDLQARSRGSYDAVLGVNGDGWRTARRLDVPFVALIKALYRRALPWERGGAHLALRVHAVLERAGARAAELVVTPSRHTADVMEREYGIDAAKLRVIPEPFDFAAWRDALPHTPRDPHRVLSVAHLYPRKRTSDLLEAWRLLAREHPALRLDLVGGGPQLRTIARRAGDLGSVRLHGHVPHPQLLQLHARAAAFVLISGQETFGYAIVEAMASGLPLVLSSAGSLPELAAGAVASSVEPGDAAGLAAAVLHSLEPEQRALASQRNPVRLTRFAPATVAAQLIDLVRSLRR